MAKTSSKSYERYEIGSFTEYLELIEELANFDLLIFRGQGCDKPLLPKIARLSDDVNDLRDFEKKIFSEFKRKCLPYLKSPITNEWDLLAIAQHFSLPTRLLDWTENPLTALWFACQHDIPKNENGVVWMFDVPEADVVGVDNKQSPFNGQRTKVFKPNHITERITSQAGWFTVHKYIQEQEKFVSLDTNKLYSGNLSKFVIPAKLFAECRVKLNKMGINHWTVFPDLDGLCKHIEWANLKLERY